MSKPTKVGPKIRELRVKRGLTMRELAALSGVEHAHICRLENGQTANPGIGTLAKLAKALKTPTASLLAA